MHDQLDRRRILKQTAAAGAALSLAIIDRCAQAAPVQTTQSEPDGYFTLGERDAHCWLLTPDRKPFFTIGLNHIDSASMRYAENIDSSPIMASGTRTRWRLCTKTPVASDSTSAGPTSETKRGDAGYWTKWSILTKHRSAWSSRPTTGSRSR